MIQITYCAYTQTMIKTYTISRFHAVSVSLSHPKKKQNGKSSWEEEIQETAYTSESRYRALK